jgi:predicted transcriptional regulator of viral defense system
VESVTNKNYLLAWIEKQQSWGLYTFGLDQVKQEFRDISESAILLALTRLSKKNRIISIYKGFYLIVPPEYSTRGVLPPVQFIDDLMNHIGKPYYVGLLSAAALYGAAHQQPQEYFIVTISKQISTQKKGIRINYFTKKEIHDNLLVKHKTPTGFVKVSSPELTAIDLIYYHNRVGGINRVCTVINELSEKISPENLNMDLIKTTSIASIQRLGYVFENVVNQPLLAKELFKLLIKERIKFFMQPLKAGGKRNDSPKDEKWKIIINTEIEIEE